MIERIWYDSLAPLVNLWRQNAHRVRLARPCLTIHEICAVVALKHVFNEWLCGHSKDLLLVALLGKDAVESKFLSSVLRTDCRLNIDLLLI